MKHLKKFSEINEGKISQFALKTIMMTISGIQQVVKKIKGTHIPLKTKDKKLERKISNDLFEILDYAVFDTLKYYFSKKYKQEANKTNLTTLIKQRCGVDVYEKIDSILSNMKKENFIFSTDPELKAKQEVEYQKLIDTVKNFKGLFKKTDDDIAEIQELISGLTDIMKDLDPRNPNNLFRDKEESIDALSRGLEKLDKMQNPDTKDMDDLLDKVSKYGINSLTDREKEDLEKHSKQEGMKYLKKFNEIKMFGDSDESEYEGPMVPSSWKEGNDKEENISPFFRGSDLKTNHDKPVEDKWAIFAGLGGGFGGANFTGEIFTGTREQAESRAYGAAQEEYEQYDGLHGLRSTEMIMDEDGVDEDEAEQIRNEEMESWLDYWVEPYDPSKHN